MTPHWTLSISGTTKTLADWGLTASVLTLRSLAASTFTCQSVPKDVTTNPLIPHGASVALYHDGNCIFSGTAHDPKLTMDGHVWRWSYTVHDLWYVLDQTMAQQTWCVWDAASAADIHTNLSRLTFGLSYDGAGNKILISTDDIVSGLLNYAAQQCGIGIGHSVNLGYTDSSLGVGSLYPPPWDAVDQTIAQAIRQVLKWHPTALSWFSYSDYNPILHIVQSANCATQTISSFDSCDLTPRHDLQAKGYIIRFELTSSVNGKDKVTLTERSWPIGVWATTPGVVVHTADWSGQTIDPPTGIAQALYNETATLQYAGTIQIVGADCDVRDWIGRVSIAGMSLGGDAYVSQVTYNLDSGTTTLSIGPQGRLGAASMLDLLSRQRAKSSTLGDPESSDYSSTSPSGGKETQPELTEEQKDALDKAVEVSELLDNGSWLPVVVSTSTGPATRQFLTKESQ